MTTPILCAIGVFLACVDAISFALCVWYALHSHDIPIFGEVAVALVCKTVLVYFEDVKVCGICIPPSYVHAAVFRNTHKRTTMPVACMAVCIDSAICFVVFISAGLVSKEQLAEYVALFLVFTCMGCCVTINAVYIYVALYAKSVSVGDAATHAHAE